MEIVYEISEEDLKLKVKNDYKSLSLIEGIFYLSIGESFFFPVKNWTDCPLIIADMWLDDLLELYLKNLDQCVLQFYEDAYEIRIDKKQTNSLLTFTHRGIELNLPDHILNFKKFMEIVLKWLHSLLNDLRRVPDIEDTKEFKSLNSKTFQLEAYIMRA